MQDSFWKKASNIAVKMVLGYLLLSAAWLAVVSWLVPLLVKNSEVLFLINSYKEWLLVVLTGIFLFMALRGVEKAIEQMETRSKILLEAIPDIVFRFDVNGVFIDYSASKEDGLAFPPEYFLGKNVSEILPQDIALQMMESIRAALKNGTVQAFKYSIQTPKGLTFNEARIVARNGEVVAFVRNVTEESRNLEAVKKSEEKFSQIFNKNPEIMWIFTLDRGVYWDVNEAFVSELGYMREEIVGKSVDEICIWEDSAVKKQMVDDLVAEKAVSNRVLKYKCKNGKVVYLLSSMSLISVGEVQCILCLAVNMESKTGVDKEW